MYPPTHLIAGLFMGQLGVQVGFFTQPQAWIVALLALLVDLDHFLFFAYKHRKFDLRAAWDAAVSGKEKGERTALHHGWGYIIFSGFLFLLWWIEQSWAWMVGLAYFSHMFLDYIPILKTKRWNFKLLKFKFQLTDAEIILNILLLLGIISLIIL